MKNDIFEKWNNYLLESNDNSVEDIYDQLTEVTKLLTNVMTEFAFIVNEKNANFDMDKLGPELSTIIERVDKFQNDLSNNNFSKSHSDM